MELGVHLPLIPLGEEPLSLQRLAATVDAARDCGFAAVSANDHLVFQTPWLDGPAALASMIERSAEMELAKLTVALGIGFAAGFLLAHALPFGPGSYWAYEPGALSWALVILPMLVGLAAVGVGRRALRAS